MKPFAFPLSFLAAVMFCAIPATGSTAEPVQTPKVDSLEMADQILVEAKESRSRIERKFLTEKLACADKFFASACEDEARERRRSALVPVRGREVEANAFKRRLRTAERDDALVEKNLSPGTAGKPRKESVPKEERRPAGDTTDTSGGGSTAEAVDQARITQVGYADREQRHEEKLKRLQAEEEADAAGRAARVAAYEKKARESEARQKEIALHKAEKSRRSEKKSSQPASSQSTSSEAKNSEAKNNQSSGK
jgi:colicin import membrane protein